MSYENHTRCSCHNRRFFLRAHRGRANPGRRFNHKVRAIPPGKTLRIETLAPAVIHWSADDWSTIQDASSHDVGLGIHIADLAINDLPAGKQVRFTFYWPDADHWEGADFAVRVGPLRPEETASAYKSEADADQG